MSEPGCLTEAEMKKLRETGYRMRPPITIFFVGDSGNISKNTADKYEFSRSPKQYYTNYLLAYGYSLRVRKERQNG